MSKIGDLHDEDTALREVNTLTGDITASNFDRLLFFIFKRLGLDADDIRVYLKARSCNLFLDHSEERIEKCSYDMGMHPNEFRKRYWRTVKLTSPLIANLSSAFLGRLY
jgi:hypothetical protein